MSGKDGPTLSVSLTVKDAGAALDFYTRALEARELYRLPMPDGTVAHAEFMIGNSRLFISGESPDWKAFAMPEGALASNLMCLEVDDCDAAYQQAIEAGAGSISAPKNEFWGMRSAVVADPFGYRWSFGQVVEDLTPEEVKKRAEELMAQGGEN